MGRNLLLLSFLFPLVARRRRLSRPGTTEPYLSIVHSMSRISSFSAGFALVLFPLVLVQISHAFIAPTSLGLRHTSEDTSLSLFNFLQDGKKALVKKLAGDYDANAVRGRIETLVAKNPVLVFSFTTCPYCIKAKACLDGKGAKYKVVELDTDDEGKAIRAEIGEMVGRTSVPAIWIDGQFIGGCNDGPMGGILQLDQRGELEGMLKKVRAIK